ncbi:minor capsid protein [Subtercola sp. PAMC28395]|uniref:minor capsid protein n=1 Tax=Subtercola sp. PAMC28395 TaxID=2846775 RepID=UPI001C0B8802|nr:minor capsid protein [Subtercola sp. PAMC28395]QWT24942.1 minor capsid protein [Subtercola sp. PAMC28395]
MAIDFGPIDAKITAALPGILAKAMEHVRAVSADLTPIETGHLVGSASVTATTDEARLLYPGPYARYQHYGLDFRHTHGQALFLEQPMITEAPKVLKIIADELGKVI